MLLFLAEVGTSAGKTLVETFQSSGWLLFGVGAAITIVPMLVSVVVGRLIFKVSVLDPLRNDDEYTGIGCSRLYGGQQHSRCGIRYGLSHCDGFSYLVYSSNSHDILRTPNSISMETDERNK